MNTDKINKWLTLVANVGVVIGLALLIFEIRQNSELVRAQVHQARAGDYDNLYYQFRQGYLDEGYYHTRIEPSIKLFANTWLTHGILDNMSASFKAEVERLAAEPD